MANKTRGLNEGFFQSCYISGLKGEIQAEVKMLKPQTMMEAISLSRLAESKLAQRRPSKFTQNRTSFPSRFQNPVDNKPAAPKHLTIEEMDARHAQGLCYNYDEKFFKGHKCAHKRLFLIDVEEPDNSDQSDEDEDPPETPSPQEEEK